MSKLGEYPTYSKSDFIPLVGYIIHLRRNRGKMNPRSIAEYLCHRTRERTARLKDVKIKDLNPLFGNDSQEYFQEYLEEMKKGIEAIARGDALIKYHCFATGAPLISSLTIGLYNLMK